MIRLDGKAIRTCRLDRGMSARDLCTATEISAPTLRRIEDDEPAPRTQMTVLMLQRLIDTLGVRLVDLLADDTPNSPGTHRAHAPEARPDDVPTLSDLLLHARVWMPKRDLALALGWTLDRLRLAAAALDHDLRPLGMQVHSVNGGLLLRPVGGYTTARRRVERRNTAENGMTVNAAVLVHQALTTGVTAKQVSQARRADLARLLRDDILLPSGEDYVAGPALLDALDVPDDDDRHIAHAT